MDPITGLLLVIGGGIVGNAIGQQQGYSRGYVQASYEFDGKLRQAVQILQANIEARFRYLEAVMTQQLTQQQLAALRADVAKLTDLVQLLVTQSAIPLLPPSEDGNQPLY